MTLAKKDYWETKMAIKWADEILKKNLKPLKKITVSEWAEKNRIIPPHKSVEPGRWRNSRTPYLVKIMDSFNDLQIENIIFCSATQVGKTQAILNQLGFLIDIDPDPALVVYPTEDTGRAIFRDFIEPMIDASPVLRAKKPYSSDDFTLSRMAFRNGAEIFLAWANSPASLASKPIRYLFLDEVDKYPVTAGKEASPIELAMERTSTFWNRKIIMVSTPTIETGHIWQAFKNAEIRFYYHVPCPHCGHYQRLIFEQVKWPKELDSLSKIEDTAYYECEKCKKKITDKYKSDMLIKGKWKGDKNIRKYKTIAFHLSGLYSPWRTFGQVARKFLETKTHPERLQNFVNSWLAEPWKDLTARIKQDEDIENLKLYMHHEKGVVPSEAVALTAGVDVQVDRFYFVIRAWANDYTSWLVLEGAVQTWDELEKILFLSSFNTTDNEVMKVELACIDSGYRTQEVYEFVARNYPRAISVKGASTDLKGRPYSLPSNDAKKQLGVSAPYLINTLYFKDFIYMRRRIPAGENGAWYIYRGVSEDYLRQITSEIRVLDKGKPKWKKRTETVPNHLWDAEVYSAAAAEILNIPYRRKEPKIKNNSIIAPAPRKKPKNPWITRRSGWLR